MISPGYRWGRGGGQRCYCPGSRVEGVTNWAEKNILKKKFIFCIKNVKLMTRK
jgi:hypothetical protein